MTTPDDKEHDKLLCERLATTVDHGICKCAERHRITELEAERDALRAALIAVTKEPQGCRFCHTGRLITPNNPEKGHDAGCGFLLAARAPLNKTAA